MTSLEERIDERIGDVRYEALDLSFGEIVNLHSASELIIQPEYQRLFRWSNAQRSRLIESILLDLPIPQVFVIENPDGVFELIDGLQRVSSVIQFINPSVLDLEPLVLEECDLIPDLNGCSFEDLPLSLRLRLKRSAVRTIVIKRQSQSFLRYEMFKRLNTGGSSLSPQEIRNCSARMLGETGETFYAFLQERARYEAFETCIETLPQAERLLKGDEELVLRFFALKNAEDKFKGSVRDWLDAYMEAVLLEQLPFDSASETKDFERLFDYLARVIGSGAFVKYRDGKPIGGLAPAYFEGVAIGTLQALDKIHDLPDSDVRQAIITAVEHDRFKEITGPGANSKQKLHARVEAVKHALEALAS